MESNRMKLIGCPDCFGVGEFMMAPLDIQTCNRCWGLGEVEFIAQSGIEEE